MFLLLSLLRKGLVSLRWTEDRDVENSSNLCCFCEAPLRLGPTLTGELSLAEALGCGLLGIVGYAISQSNQISPHHFPTKVFKPSWSLGANDDRCWSATTALATDGGEG